MLLLSDAAVMTCFAPWTYSAVNSVHCEFQVLPISTAVRRLAPPKSCYERQWCGHFAPASDNPVVGPLGNLSLSLIPPTAVLLPLLGTSTLPPMSNYMGVKSFSVPTLRQDKTHVTPMADSCQCMAKTTTIL